ncbi:hypothetical protein BV97_02525 [Novosphingobium resinovorum]|uniref:Uncharacterized protein n=1 Tax=Novosphingobium resinovorum TaxID=158500 RepID=A0A031JZV1_9SPHN|nr:hypothetical protein BV97_02525 [Novosphingobium resinovorum]
MLLVNATSPGCYDCDPVCRDTRNPAASTTRLISTASSSPATRAAWKSSSRLIARRARLAATNIAASSAHASRSEWRRPRRLTVLAATYCFLSGSRPVSRPAPKALILEDLDRPDGDGAWRIGREVHRGVRIGSRLALSSPMVRKDAQGRPMRGVGPKWRAAISAFPHFPCFSDDWFGSVGGPRPMKMSTTSTL